MSEIKIATTAARISRRLVDPELLGFADSFQRGELSDDTLHTMRASTPLPETPPELGVTVVGRHIPGLAGAPDVRLLILTPEGLGVDAPALIFIHGGGYVAGKPEQMQPWGMKLAKQTGCVVVLPSYRLAPETRWPGPVEDLYAALCWLTDKAGDLGVDHARIAIGGSSAGGGHAAALALHVRAHGGPPILFQLLLSPMLDDRDVSDPFAGEFVWPRQANRYGWSSLLGMPAGGPDVPTKAVPGRVEDLSGLPPAYIGVGALDLFAESNIEYARRLMAAGVSTELHVLPGAYHGFEFLVPEAAVSKVAMADVPRALRAAFNKAKA
jgi:acetyl esterase/lipase